MGFQFYYKTFGEHELRCVLVEWPALPHSKKAIKGAHKGGGSLERPGSQTCNQDTLG